MKPLKWLLMKLYEGLLQILLDLVLILCIPGCIVLGFTLGFVARVMRGTEFKWEQSDKSLYTIFILSAVLSLAIYLGVGIALFVH